MNSSADPTEAFPLSSIVNNKVAYARILCGVTQGLLLSYLLEKETWPAELIWLLGVLLLITIVLPPLLISSLGHLSSRATAKWIIASALILAGLEYYDAWRGAYSLFSTLKQHDTFSLSNKLLVLISCGFYIAQVMILSAAYDKKTIANYGTYFNTAWKLTIQIIFSTIFACLLWLLVTLGAMLFRLIGIDFLDRLLYQTWFYTPLLTTAFCFSFHLTDVRPHIVIGIRSLLLTLLSWLLPLIVFITGTFLIGLLWTGITPLWATGYATKSLISTAIVLIILINSAYQNGQITDKIPRIMRITVRLGALLLLPITIIAIDSLALRIMDYGWTENRISAAACLLIITLYALGYAWACCTPQGKMKRIATTNIFAAIITIATLLATLSPIADPTRISVASQLHRLQTKAVSAHDFDYYYLRYNGTRFGANALEKLSHFDQGNDSAYIRAQAIAFINNKGTESDVRFSPSPEKPLSLSEISANIQVFPNTKSLPETFLTQNWISSKQRWSLPMCLTSQNMKCDAYFVNLSSNKKQQILLSGHEDKNTLSIFELADNAKWQHMGTLHLPMARCPQKMQQFLVGGHYQQLSPTFNDIVINGQRLHITPPPLSSNIDDLICEKEPKNE